MPLKVFTGLVIILQKYKDYMSVLIWNPQMDLNAYYYASLWLLITWGAVSIRKTVLPGMAIPMLKIRRPNGRLIFNMENAIRR